jgi:hypothetical protein
MELTPNAEQIFGVLHLRASGEPLLSHKTGLRLGEYLWEELLSLETQRPYIAPRPVEG